MATAPFTVAIDTREQHPLDFTPDALRLYDDAGPRATGKPLYIPTYRERMHIGDYGIRPHDAGGPILGCRIERKSKADLYSSMSTAGKRQNWEGRLEQMCAALDFGAVVVESTFEDAMANPPAHTQFAPKAMSRTILAWMVRYPGVHWIWRDGRAAAAATTYRVLERWYLDKRAQQMATQGDGGTTR